MLNEKVRDASAKTAITGSEGGYACRVFESNFIHALDNISTRSGKDGKGAGGSIRVERLVDRRVNR